MLTLAEQEYFLQQQAILEASYLGGGTAQKQSGFRRGAQAWERFRRPIVRPIHKSGSFLDIGCANGLLMESVATWAAQDGLDLEVFGLDISEELVALARSRLPRWQDRIHVGNALVWEPPTRYDFVRTELVYVPATLRRQYVERLLQHLVAPDGKLILCSYGSSRLEGSRPEVLTDELESWGFPIARIDEATCPNHALVVTRVVTLDARGDRAPRMPTSQNCGQAVPRDQPHESP